MSFPVHKITKSLTASRCLQMIGLEYYRALGVTRFVNAGFYWWYL